MPIVRSSLFVSIPYDSQIELELQEFQFLIGNLITP